MELKNLDDTCTALEAKAAEMTRQVPDAEPGWLADMVPERPGSSEEHLHVLERELGQKLPTPTRTVISHYELGSISLAGVAFGGSPTLVDFLGQQLENPEQVWGEFEPIKGTLVLGSSPGWLIVTSVSTGEVLGAPIDRPNETFLVVAASLDLFVRALGHLVVSENIDDPEGHAAELAQCVQAPEAERFWCEAIMGFV